MTAPSKVAEDLVRYETLLLAAAERAFENAAEETAAPWVGVALGYHHGLSFGPVLGVLPASEYEDSKEEFDSPNERFNPAEWLHWDDEIQLEDEELDQLARRLEKLHETNEAVLAEARPGREIHVRVATALRNALMQAGLLTQDALVFATEYGQSDWEGNVRASNPADACAAHGL